MRTLVIAPNWIGDAVMAQPLLAFVAQSDPDGTIDVLAPPHVAPVFRAMPQVSGVIEFAQVHGSLQWRARWALARRLRAGGYGRCYVLPNSLKSALVPFLAGIPERIGRRGESRWLLINRMHDGDARDQPMIDFYAQLAFAPGSMPPVKVPAPELARDDDAAAAARARLGLGTADPLLLLCPGAEYGPAKCWPARHYASLASLAAARWPQVTIALLGSAKDRALATEIAALSGQRLRNLCGETSLGEALALISTADGVVSNDSGLMHAAAAYRRPQAAVFGSSDPRHTPPLSKRAEILWLHLECSPCFSRTCPLGHTNCLNQIGPDEVFGALSRAMRFDAETPPG